MRKVLFPMLGALMAASSWSALGAFLLPIETGADPYRKGSRRIETRRTRYLPHQGDRECARRRRQLARLALGQSTGARARRRRWLGEAERRFSRSGLDAA